MGRMKETPRYNVISARITDEQMLLLKRLRSEHEISFSALIREALERLSITIVTERPDVSVVTVTSHL